MNTLSRNVCFFKMDASSAFHQIKDLPTGTEHNSFVTRYGLYEFARMGFGLCNPPATFSRTMNFVCAGPHLEYCTFLLERALVIDKGFEDHLANLRSVFARFREFDQKLKQKKCALFQRRVEFLGRQVSPQGVEMGDSYVDIVRDWAASRSTKDVERIWVLPTTIQAL